MPSNQANIEPVFKNISGSTDDPGQFGTINYGQRISAYEVFTVPSDRIFVLEYVSAVVMRGSIPYPPENLNDHGAVGYTADNNSAGHFHAIPFIRSEPGGMLRTSQAIRIHIPPNATVIVKVPVISNQSGGADINVSGYYLRLNLPKPPKLR